jgi:oligopeptide transport system ATP-binding protein
MTVRDIVAEGIEIFGLAASQRSTDDMVRGMLERVGLSPEVMPRYPHAFSGGQRQRIAIARALAVKPDFLVLDEPLSALDLSVQAQIINLLDELQKKLSLTQLFISHDLRAVQYVSHRMAVMQLGRIVEMGPTTVVAKLRYHPYTRALFDAMKPDDMPDAVHTAEAAASASRLPLVSRLPLLNRIADGMAKGCAYAPRCERREGRCDRERPELREIETGSHHRVACWQPYLDS